jgi:basic amino acid/polyamine antiporter, APA family
MYSLHFAPMSSPISAPAKGEGSTAGRVGYDARLGTFSGTMLVVGGIIGAGIFLSPAVVAQRVGTASLTLGAWGLGALVAIIGGFVYAELGARRPHAGGTYIYLRDAWGPLPAFLYGWALFLIMATGAIAAVAMTGSSYLATLLGWSPDSIRPMAIGIIALLTVLNILGVKIGATTGNVLTMLKLGAIAVLVFAALVLSPSHAAPLAASPVVLQPPTGGMATVLAMGAALVPVLFSYGGWQQTNAVAEELVDPSRTLPRALIIGVLVVVATYMLVNVAYLRALGVQGLASSTAPAADTMFVYLGSAGRTLITFGIVTSTVGFLGMVILMSARVYQAMAADGLFFRSMAELHPRTRTPVAALLAQFAVALALLLTGTYGQLLDYVVFADWIFFGSTAAALFVLRARDAKAGFTPTVKTPLHPVSTLIFIAAAVYVVIGSISSNPGNAARGAGLLALGLPVFAYWRRKSPRGATGPSA